MEMEKNVNRTQKTTTTSEWKKESISIDYYKCAHALHSNGFVKGKLQVANSIHQHYYMERATSSLLHTIVYYTLYLLHIFKGVEIKYVSKWITIHQHN